MGDDEMSLGVSAVIKGVHPGPATVPKEEERRD